MRKNSKQAAFLAAEAEEIIARFLPEGTWPQRRTVEKFLASGQLEHVLVLYNRAMLLDAKEPSCPWNFSGFLRRVGLNEMALAFVERAIVVATEIGDTAWAGPGAHLAWAETALDAGQLDVALVALAKAKRLRPSGALNHSIQRMLKEIARKSQDAHPADSLAGKLRAISA